MLDHVKKRKDFLFNVYTEVDKVKKGCQRVNFLKN